MNIMPFITKEYSHEYIKAIFGMQHNKYVDGKYVTKLAKKLIKKLSSIVSYIKFDDDYYQIEFNVIYEGSHWMDQSINIICIHSGDPEYDFESGNYNFYFDKNRNFINEYEFERA